MLHKNAINRTPYRAKSLTWKLLQNCLHIVLVLTYSDSFQVLNAHQCTKDVKKGQNIHSFLYYSLLNMAVVNRLELYDLNVCVCCSSYLWCFRTILKSNMYMYHIIIFFHKIFTKWLINPKVPQFHSSWNVSQTSYSDNIRASSNSYLQHSTSD